MDIINILSFLCGSLAATMIFTFFVYRQMTVDERLIRHIRSTSYKRGWQDGKNSQFQE